MGEKKQLNVRIPLELQEKIDKSGRPKIDIVTEALNFTLIARKKKAQVKAVPAKMLAVLAKLTQPRAMKYRE